MDEQKLRYIASVLLRVQMELEDKETWHAEQLLQHAIEELGDVLAASPGGLDLDKYFTGRRV